MSNLPPPPPPPAGSDGPPEEPAEHAAFHITQQTRTYPCRQCGAHLIFDITSQKPSPPRGARTAPRPSSETTSTRRRFGWPSTGYCRSPSTRCTPRRWSRNGSTVDASRHGPSSDIARPARSPASTPPTSPTTPRFSTDYRGKRGDETGSGDNRSTRWRPASGRVWTAFNDEAVLANDGFDRKRVRELEPWPTSKARPFSPEFVAGHLSRTYDWDAQVCFGEAKQIIDRRIDKVVRRDIGGDQQRIESLRSSYHSLLYKHLLLPIWLLTVMHQGKPFQVYLNGVTGEVQGQRPYSAVKIVALVLAIVTVVIVLFALFGGSGSESG